MNLCFDNNCIYVSEDQHHQQRMTTWRTFKIQIDALNSISHDTVFWNEREREREEEIVRTHAPSNRQTKNNDSKENRSLFLLQN